MRTNRLGEIKAAYYGDSIIFMLSMCYSTCTVSSGCEELLIKLKVTI